jgi:hypothetical protein
MKEDSARAKGWFRGVIEEEHIFVRTRNRAGIAVGRPGDQFVCEIESSKRVDR